MGRRQPFLLFAAKQPLFFVFSLSRFNVFYIFGVKKMFKNKIISVQLWTDLAKMPIHSILAKKKFYFYHSERKTWQQKVTVVQSNKLIEARYSLTVGEARLILAMVSHIKPTDTDFAEYKIPLAELARMFDLSPSNIYGDIDQIIDKLMSRVLRIYQENGKILKIQWICRAVHDTGSVTLSFVPDLKPYLLLLKREFTIIDLDAVKNFQSIYSIRLYQLLKQYLPIGWLEFGLDELKEILGLESDQYQVFSDFKANSSAKGDGSEGQQMRPDFSA